MNKADEINNHLANGGVIQLVTYNNSIIYNKKNAGDFKLIDGFLHVRYGRRYNCLEQNSGMLVKIKFGRYA